MDIALIGPSGVGKGTHARHLVERFGLEHVSTGDLFRRNLTERTPLGVSARAYMDAGELVPDEITESMMEAWLRSSDPGAGALFDGFPRTVAQAEFLDQLLGELGRTLDAVLYFEVTEDALLDRLRGRLLCPDCGATYHRDLRQPRREAVCDRCGGALHQRPDDRHDSVRNRLRVFHRASSPLLDFYHASNRLVVVPGEGRIEAVRERITTAIEAAARREKPATSAADVDRLKAAAPAVALPAPTAATLDLVLLGGPGSGKGTQAERLAAVLELPHIATGDLFRDNLKRQTELGKLAETYMSRGELVPDDVTDAMVAERLSRPDTAKGFILDGFPRTLSQAESLGEILSDARRRLAGVLYIDVSDDAIVRRLSGRLICRDCQTPFHVEFNPPPVPGQCDRCGGELYQRDDDRAETIRQRLETYHRQTAPLIDFYRGAGLLQDVPGEGPLEAVNARVLEAVERVRSKR